MIRQSIRETKAMKSLGVEKQSIQRRIFISFSDLAILVALKNQSLTGYGINNYFLKKVGDAASPSTVYSSLAALERKGWIECIAERRGRVYSLTTSGRQVVDKMDATAEDIKLFMDKLLKSR